MSKIGYSPLERRFWHALSLTVLVIAFATNVNTIDIIPTGTNLSTALEEINTQSNQQSS